jgi:hypothetical protein
VKIDFDSQNEVQNVCLSHNDKLMFRLADILEFRFRAKMNQAAVNAATTFTAGLTSARNDNADSPTVNAQFKIDGSVSTTLVVVETDDNVNDNDDKATGKTLINAEKEFVISFANGLSDVRFFIDGEPVALGGGASQRWPVRHVERLGHAAVQPNFQLSKTAAPHRRLHAPQRRDRLPRRQSVSGGQWPASSVAARHSYIHSPGSGLTHLWSFHVGQQIRLVRRSSCPTTTSARRCRLRPEQPRRAARSRGAAAEDRADAAG